MNNLMQTPLPIRIRAATEEDISFIFNSWLKSFRDSNFGKQITNTIYFAQHHKLIENLLQSCNVFVACNESNPGELYGYICYEKVDGIFVMQYCMCLTCYLIGLIVMLCAMATQSPSIILIVVFIPRLMRAFGYPLFEFKK